MTDRITKGLGQKLFPDSNSIVDTLKASGQDSSFEARSKLAAQAGIQNYSGTADQNLKLLATLKNKNNTTSTDNGTSSINANVSNTTNLSTGQTVDDTTLAVSQNKATYGVDPAVDNLIASQYKNAEDKKYETYVDKIGMETGIYADIQNIDTQVLETYKILGMSDQDIFSRQDITAEEKIAMSNQRKSIATNKINQLRKLQQAKQSEIKELADFEAKKAEAQQAEYKAAMDYMKQVNEQNKYNLDVAKFNLDVTKAQSASELAISKYNLDVAKYEETKYDKYFKGINNTTLLDVPDGTILKSRLAETTNPNGGKECAEYVNDTMAGSIPRFGSGYTDKLNVANEDYGTIGAAAVWNPGNTEYGHVGIIVGAEGDNWIIKSSNLRNDGAISTDLVPKSDIQGYRNTNVKSTGDKNVDFGTAFDYLNSTIPNIPKLITPETGAKILISDMEEGNMPKDKIKQLAQLGKVSPDLVDDYTSIRYANQFWSTLSDDDIVTELKAMKWDGMTDEDKLTSLVELELAGKLNNGDGQLFEGGWLEIDEPGFDILQDHFDDVNDSIDQAKQIATKIREKYNLK